MISRKNFESLLHQNAEMNPQSYSSTWLNQRNQINNLKKQEKIDLRNQSRQLSQKLIEQCNRRANQKPNLFQIDDEDNQQYYMKILKQKLGKQNKFMTQFDKQSQLVSQEVNNFVQKSQNIVNLLANKEENQNDEQISLYLSKDLQQSFSQKVEDNTQYNMHESNQKLIFPQLQQNQQTHNRQKSMTQQQKLNSTYLDLQQTHDLDSFKRRVFSKTKNSTGYLKSKRSTNNSTSNLINVYKQNQQNQNLYFKVQNLKDRQDQLSLESKRNK